MSSSLARRLSLKPVCGDAIAIIWFPQRRGNTGEKAVLEPFQTGNMLKIGTQTKQALKNSITWKIRPCLLMANSHLEFCFLSHLRRNQCCPEAILIYQYWGVMEALHRMPSSFRKDLCMEGVQARLQGDLHVSDSHTLVQNRHWAMKGKPTLTSKDERSSLTAWGFF